MSKFQAKTSTRIRFPQTRPAVSSRKPHLCQRFNCEVPSVSRFSAKTSAQNRFRSLLPAIFLGNHTCVDVLMAKPRSCRGFQPERMHGSDFAARRLRSLIGNPICVDVSVAKSHLCQRLPAKSNLCCCFEPKPQHRFDLAERHLRFLQRNPFYVDVFSENVYTKSISQAPRPSVVARANSREALKHLVTHGKIPSNERIPSKRPRHGNHEAVPRTTRHPNAQKEQASNPVEDAKLEVRGRPPPACAEYWTPWMVRISRTCQKEGNRPPTQNDMRVDRQKPKGGDIEPPTDSILLAPEFPERRIVELASHLKRDAADRSGRTEGRRALSPTGGRRAPDTCTKGEA